MNDLEQIAGILEASDDYRVLRRLPARSEINRPDGTPVKYALFLDLETTGLNPEIDEIIEIGIVPFSYSDDGRIFEIGNPYQALREPSVPITDEIIRITGITPDMVKGHLIDVPGLEAFAEKIDLVIAHNAEFDRKFMEALVPSFCNKSWACSMSQVRWKEEGCDGQRLSHIAAQLGFFYDAHRAIGDCRAGIEILSRPLLVSKVRALSKLLEEANKDTVRIWAKGAPFDLKDVLKARGYRWNSGDDGRHKSWYKDFSEAEYQAELNYLATEIFGRSVNLPITKITPRDRFSKRV